MKVAIASSGGSLSSKLDKRFGRCAYFAIYNTESKTTSFIENPYKEAEDGAGPSAVELLATHEVDKIVSSEFGVKIRSLLDGLNIQMVIIKDADKSIEDIVNLLNH